MAGVLSLFVEAMLTKHQHLLIMDFVNSTTLHEVLSSECFEIYGKVLPRNTVVTESQAELESVSDCTASRILMSEISF